MQNLQGHFVRLRIRATKELKDIIGTNKVICQKKTTDRYRRSISVCFVNVNNINSLMVKNGWALTYRKYFKDYVKDKEKAKKRKSVYGLVNSYHNGNGEY